MLAVGKGKKKKSVALSARPALPSPKSRLPAPNNPLARLIHELMICVHILDPSFDLTTCAIYEAAV
jgi:hypothetical protein